MTTKISSHDRALRAWANDPKSAYDLTGMYGKNFKQGLLIDHVGQAEANGYQVRTSASGLVQWLICEDGKTFPVVCGDFIEVRDSDGMPVTGRCGLTVEAGMMACEGHAAERTEYAAMSEAERIELERREDGEAF